MESKEMIKEHNLSLDSYIWYQFYVPQEVSYALLLLLIEVVIPQFKNLSHFRWPYGIQLNFLIFADSVIWALERAENCHWLNWLFHCWIYFQIATPKAMLLKHWEPFWNLLIKVNIDNLLSSKIQVEDWEPLASVRDSLVADSILKPGVGDHPLRQERQALGGGHHEEAAAQISVVCWVTEAWHLKLAEDLIQNLPHRTDGNAILNLIPFHLRAVEEKTEDQLRILNIVDFVLQGPSNCYHKSNLPGMYKH